MIESDNLNSNFQEPDDASSLVFRAVPTDVDRRLDVYLSENVPDWSRARLQKLIDDGDVSVNGKPVKPSYKLRPNDEIEVELTETLIEQFIPENIPLDVVFEDLERTAGQGSHQPAVLIHDTGMKNHQPRIGAERWILIVGGSLCERRCCNGCKREETTEKAHSSQADKTREAAANPGAASASPEPFDISRPGSDLRVYSQGRIDYAVRYRFSRRRQAIR